MLRSFLTFTAALLLGLSLSSCAASGPSSTDLIGKMAPYTRFTMLDGELLASENLKGKTVVLIFWASWCRRSPKVLERVNEYARKFAGRDDVVFLTASVDKAENLPAVKERIEFSRLDAMKHAFSGNEAYDEAYMAYHEHSIPTIFIIDRNGYIVARGDDVDVVLENVK